MDKETEESKNTSLQHKSNLNPTLLITGGIMLVLLFVLLFQNLELKQELNALKSPPTNQITSLPSPSISSAMNNTTANWKTHTDSVYGFEIKFPKSWFVYPTEGSKTQKAYPGDSLFASTFDKNDPNNFDAKLKLNNQVNDPLNLEIIIATDNQKTLSQIKNEESLDIGKIINNPDYIVDSVSDTIFDSIPSILINYKNQKLLRLISINSKKHMFSLSFSIRDESFNNQQLRDQILSSFRFTETDTADKSVSLEKVNYEPKSDWQTLTDPIAKFSLQYPKSYKIDHYANGDGGNLLSCVTNEKTGELCMSGFSVKVYNNYYGGSRREWLYKQNSYVKDFLIDPFFKDLNVQGANVLVIMDNNIGGSTGSWVIIPKGTQVILLTFPVGGNAGSPGYNSIRKFLSTFKFL